VMLCVAMGYATGIAMPPLVNAVQFRSDVIGTRQGGRAHYCLSKNAA